LDLLLNSFETKAVGFCKRAADVVVLKFFIKFFTVRESNDRQTFNWMKVAVRAWDGCQTIDESNSIKFKTTFVGKHTTYVTLMEQVNTFVAILPNEKLN